MRTIKYIVFLLLVGCTESHVIEVPYIPKFDYVAIAVFAPSINGDSTRTKSDFGAFAVVTPHERISSLKFGFRLRYVDDRNVTDTVDLGYRWGLPSSGVIRETVVLRGGDTVYVLKTIDTLQVLEPNKKVFYWIYFGIPETHDTYRYWIYTFRWDI